MTQITVSLSPAIIALLRGKGLTSAAAADLLGCGPRQAARLLRLAGAKRGTSVMGVWKMGAGQ